MILQNNKIRNYFLALLSLIIPLFLIYLLASDINSVERVISTAGITGPLASILLMAVLSLTPIPTDPIVVLNGALFGIFVGAFVSWIGNNLAAVIEYFIGRGLSSITDFDHHKKKLPFGLAEFPASSPWFLIFGRFIPQFGGKLVSLVGGFYRVNFSRYLWTAALSNLIGSILFAYGGHILFTIL